MPEELRIVVTDTGEAPGDGRAIGGGGPTSRAPSAAPTPKPPPFVQPPPIVKPPSRPERERRRPERIEASARGGISQVGQIGTALAAGRIGGAVAGAGGALTAIAGPVGVAAAAIAASLTIATTAVRSFSQMVQQQVSELSGLSPFLGRARAETELRRFRAQFRRAERLGPGLAAAERFRSRFEEQMTNLNTEMLAVQLRLFEQFRPGLEQALKLIGSTSEFVDARGEQIATLLGNLLRATVPIVRVVDLLGLIAENTDPEEDDLTRAGPFAQEFMNLLPTAPWFWPEDQPKPARRPVPGI